MPNGKKSKADRLFEHICRCNAASVAHACRIVGVADDARAVKRAPIAMKETLLSLARAEDKKIGWTMEVQMPKRN